MKKLLFIISILFITSCKVITIKDYNDLHTIDSLKYEITIKDSIINNTNDSILYYKNLLKEYKQNIDTCELVKDSLFEEIQIRDIKLARIKEYNRIAAQGNNIKFLRGWINRVLE